MELDEMKLAWQALDRRLEKLATLELEQQRETRMESAQRSLRSLTRGQVFQIFAGVVLCLLFAPYGVAHRDVLHMALCGFALHAYGIMFIAFAVRAIVLIRQVDYSLPVLAIQQRMAALSRWKLRVEWPAFAVVGCFIWIPLTLILFRSMGADIWLHAPEVVYSFIASGFVCLGVVGLAVRLITRGAADPMPGSLALRLCNSAIGSSVRRAQAQLADITRFEQD